KLNLHQFRTFLPKPGLWLCLNSTKPLSAVGVTTIPPGWYHSTKAPVMVLLPSGPDYSDQ
ncbi:Hypothetical predicted protein, partial [Marmota monax]